jgi:phosphatidylserine decarboxylase
VITGSIVIRFDPDRITTRDILAFLARERYLDSAVPMVRDIVQRTQYVRYSRRYPGYLRGYHRQFRLALARTLMTEAADLVEALKKLDEPESGSAAGKLARGILREAGARSPMSAHAQEFNRAAERYYRSTLKKRHIAEAIEVLREDFRAFDACDCGDSDDHREAVRYAVRDGTMSRVLETMRGNLLEEKAPAHALRTMIDLVLITINRKAADAEKFLGERERNDENPPSVHQAATGEVCEETFLGDRSVKLLYSVARESVPAVFRALTSARASSLLGFVNFDLTSRLASRSFCRRNGIDLSEVLDPPEDLNTLRKIFERKIRYWECRPMPADPHAVVSPADAKVIVGSLAQSSLLFLKEKFFRVEELLGLDKQQWIDRFAEGDFSGRTKKISYESGLDGCEVVPVQALTTVICTAGGLVGMLLYLKGLHFAAFGLTMTVTQMWRAASENLRADYRGGGRMSAYQIMAVVAMPYSLL